LNVDEPSDQARFTEVFVPYLVDAFRFARWLAGSRADAEDIVQEASMRAFKNIRGFSGGNPRAWVPTIVTESRAQQTQPGWGLFLLADVNRIALAGLRQEAGAS
jgi:DNA-directed RNA polymerase specialized sigma24 family protein